MKERNVLIITRTRVKLLNICDCEIINKNERSKQSIMRESNVGLVASMTQKELCFLSHLLDRIVYEGVNLSHCIRVRTKDDRHSAAEYIKYYTLYIR